jgi:basic amino acid/polyamine antiporter, APA family
MPEACPSTPASRPRLIGLWTCIALVIGNMVGTGIFMLPAQLAPFGANSLWGWLLTIAGALALTEVFALLARALPGVNGPYHFPRMAFGPFAGFVSAWSYWVSIWVSTAAISIGGTSYLLSLLNVAAPGAAAPLIAIGLVWLLTGVNALGVRAAGVVQILTTLLKISPLLLVAVCGLAHSAPVRMEAFFSVPFSGTATAAAAAITLYAMLGFECATVPGERVRNPERTIPLATRWGAVVTALFYILACTAVQFLVPADKLGDSRAPFADAAFILFGGGGAAVLGLVGVISALGALNGWILLQAELPVAMAREGVFPALFARRSRREVPLAGLVIASGLCTLLVLSNYTRTFNRLFAFMVLVTTAANLVTYLLAALAALWLARQGRLRPRVRRLVPTACAGVLFALLTFYGSGREAVLWVFALVAAGVPVYAAMRFRVRAERGRPARNDPK